MQRSWAAPFVETFENAFAGMKVDYQTNPFIFLNKWDVVSDLYSRMRAIDEAREVKTARYTIGRDGRWREKRFSIDPISTKPLHISMGFDRGERGRADICYIDLSTMQVAVTARYSKKRPASIASWRFSSGAGISVVMNTEVQYARRRNTTTGRFSKTEGMREIEREINREITDLKSWDKSILLFVDNHGLFTRNELDETFSRKLNPYTMKLYYLSPKSGFFITGKRKQKDDI
ncbi:MAG TPA: hypothetical protein ENK47_07140 [Euryarchaeota archaeon]|nr:MAG: hypothetical protein DRN57_05720 [Thermoplasmata archaeon]HHD16468.1 hypothetical protein [Euryarchaeota archaeon]